MLSFSSAFGAHAQEAPSAAKAIKVGIYVSPPFVMQDGDGFTGMAIELWEHISPQLGVKPVYQEFRNYRELVDAVASGAVDAAVTNLSITEERARILDFSHPWYDAGLRVMVNKQADGGFWSVINDLGEAGHLDAYLWLLAIIVAATVILTLFDRKFDRDFTRRWGQGMADSFYHVMSVATSGKTSHKHLFGSFGKMFAALWMVCGVAVVAYMTSTITSVMTAAHLTSQINSVADLQGTIVGARAGSVSQQYANASSIRAKPFDHARDAIEALQNEEITAIIGDSPVLEYFAHSNPDLPVSVVGNTFQPDKYGFAFNLNSELTRPASIAVIRAYETGEIEKIRSHYFGFRP
ncbi:MAG: transporter substrate-binding domain-containing protein [Phyllobacterium sp.]